MQLATVIQVLERANDLTPDMVECINQYVRSKPTLVGYSGLIAKTINMYNRLPKSARIPLVASLRKHFPNS
jgi:hypothetical protein